MIGDDEIREYEEWQAEQDKPAYKSFEEMTIEMYFAYWNFLHRMWNLL